MQKGHRVLLGGVILRFKVRIALQVQIDRRRAHLRRPAGDDLRAGKGQGVQKPRSPLQRIAATGAPAMGHTEVLHSKPHFFRFLRG